MEKKTHTYTHTLYYYCLFGLGRTCVVLFVPLPSLHPIAFFSSCQHMSSLKYFSIWKISLFLYFKICIRGSPYYPSNLSRRSHRIRMYTLVCSGWVQFAYGIPRRHHNLLLFSTLTGNRERCVSILHLPPLNNPHLFLSHAIFNIKYGRSLRSFTSY